MIAAGNRVLWTLTLRIVVPLVAAVAVVAMFNVVVDPYDAVQILAATRFNDHKPREWQHARLAKVLTLARGRWDAIALGPSQVERSIDPENPALTNNGIRLYNAGVTDEAERAEAVLLRLAARRGNLRFAVIGLSFYLSAKAEVRHDDEKPQLVASAWTLESNVAELLEATFSPSELASSIDTIGASVHRRPSMQHLRNGLLNVEPTFVPPDHRDAFDQVDDIYLNDADTYSAVLAIKPGLERNGFNHTALQDMLATARQYGVELFIFFPPDHARHCETRRLVGVEPLFRQWQREVTQVVAAEAGPGRQRFPVWDFGGYNGVTTEAVPGAPQHMLWYNDTVHFTYRTGRAITDRMLGFPDPELEGITDFGERVTAETVDAHFARQDEARARIISVHPELVADVERLYHRH